MARAVTAMLAIQSKDGLVFGQMVQWSRRQLEFELAMELEPDVEYEFRVEMIGLQETVLGRLKVLARQPKVDGISRHVARMLWVHPEDVARYDEWANAFEMGRPPSTLTATDNQTGFGTGSMRGTSAAERARITKEMEDRKRSRETRAREVLQATKKVWPNPFDAEAARVAAAIAFVESIGVAPGPAEDAVVRGFAPPVPPPEEIAAPEPAPPAAPPVARPAPPRVEPTPTPVARPAPPRVEPTPTPPPARTAPPPPPPGRPPFQVSLDRTRAIPRVTLTWNDAARFRDDARRHLRHGAMPVEGDPIGPVGGRVDVALVTPDGHTLPCLGRIVVVHEAYTGLELELGAGMCAAFAVM